MSAFLFSFLLMLLPSSKVMHACFRWKQQGETEMRASFLTFQSYDQMVWGLVRWSDDGVNMSLRRIRGTCISCCVAVGHDIGMAKY